MKNPVSLPILEVLPSLVSTLCTKKRVVVVAAAGAGKTTLLPEAIARRLRAPSTAPPGRVVVTQPRRLAARAAARRTALLRGEPCGSSVGYQVRFDDCTSSRTELVFVTEGLFLRQLLAGPQLDGIACLVLDEFHGRTRELDVILGIVLAAHRQAARPFFLVVMSATLDAERLSRHLLAPIVEVAGRPFPVEIEYLAKAETCALETQVARALVRALDPKKDDGGDILVFLPGQKEIARALRSTTSLLGRHGIEGVALYGAMAPKAQDEVLSAAPHRRCVFSTNLAETSVTLPKVTIVVDSGLARTLICDPATGIAGLRVQPADRAALTQRAGRAGRVAPGRCLRLLTRLEEGRRPSFSTPELLRLDLTEPTLQLAAACLPSLLDLPLLDAPDQSACRRAMQELQSLGALETRLDHQLTPLGRALATLPLHPRVARLALSLTLQGHRAFAARAAAVLGESVGRNEAKAEVGDAAYDSDLELYLSYARPADSEAHLITGQLTQRLGALATEGAGQSRQRPRAEALTVACLEAFGDRVAKRLPPLGPRAGDLPLQMARGGRAALSEKSCVRSADFLIPLCARTMGPLRPLQIDWAHAITADELLMHGGDHVDERHEVTYDTRLERIIASTRIVFDDLVLSESGDTFTPQASIGEVLVEAMRKLVATQGLGAILDEARLKTLRGRVETASLGGGIENAQFRAVDDAEVWRAVVEAARSSRSRLDIQKADVVSKIEANMGPQVVHQLQAHAPSHLSVGRKKTSLPIIYAAGEKPHIRARLQVFFGMQETPTLGPHRVPVVVHLLGPNMRVLQVTQDLAGFWTTHYPKLRPALMRRYPRHAWPEDPLSG